MADGSLRISTKLDNSDIDKDIVQLENKIKKLQINNKKKSHEQDSLQEEINEYNKLIIEAEEYRNKIEQLNNEKKQMIKDNPALAVSVDTPEYANVKNQIEEIKQKYQETTIEIDKQSPKIEKSKIKLEEVKAQQEENNSKISEYNKKLEEAKNKQQEVNYSTKGISKELNTGIKKILRYGAALISIRSVYGLLSSAANSWLNGNNSVAKQLKSDIDYMKNAIGHALSPVIKYIVDLLYQALGFTGALIKAFTGIDIFAGSVADYMSKTTSSASKTNKELKKQLLSFDRINKLNDDSSNSSGGSGVGTIAPSQDLSKIMNKYTEQAEKIKGIFGDIKDYIVEAGLAFAGWKLGDLLGLSTMAKAGLAIGIASLKFYNDGIKGIRDGEITGEDLLKSIGGALGLGVSAGMLTGSVSVGLAVALIATFNVVNEIGQAKRDNDVLGVILKASGLSKWLKKNGSEGYGIDVAINMHFFAKWVMEDVLGLGDQLNITMKKILLNTLEDLAKWIKNIPIIGNSIGTAIESGIKAMKGEMTTTTKKTIEEFTSEAAEGAKNIVIYQGERTGATFSDSLNKKVRLSKDEFRKAIEDSSTNATNDAKNTVDNNGKRTGTTYANNMKEQLANSKKEISNVISRTTEDATNFSLSSVKESGKKTGTEYTGGIIESEKAHKISLSTNLTDIVKEANKNVDTSSSNEVGSNIISGVKSGINNNKTSLFSTITSVGSTLLSTLKKTLGIHSPSREMASLAKFIPLGIAEGIDSTQDKAIGSMKSLVGGLEDTMSDIDYSNITEIPKIPRNAVTYIPKQSISTNEIQRSIVGQDSSVINKLLSNLQTGSNKNMTVTIPLIIDGEEILRKVITLNSDYNLATNGGGL